MQLVLVFTVFICFAESHQHIKTQLQKRDIFNLQSESNFFLFILFKKIIYIL